METADAEVGSNFTGGDRATKRRNDFAVQQLQRCIIVSSQVQFYVLPMYLQIKEAIVRGELGIVRSSLPTRLGGIYNSQAEKHG